MENEPGFWGSLPERERETLGKNSAHRSWRAGETIFYQAPAETIVVLRSGLAKVKYLGWDYPGTMPRLYKSGDILGYEALGSSASMHGHVANAACLTDVYGMVITAERFDDLLHRHPMMNRAVTRALVDHVIQTELLRSPAPERGISRTVRQLAELFRQYGTKTPEGIALPLTQSDVAELLGTSRESLARTLRELRHKQAIKTENKSLTVPDLYKLVKYWE